MVVFQLLLLLAGTGVQNTMARQSVISPSGPRLVGSFLETFEQADREEVFTEEPDDARRFVVQFWYPTDSAESPPLPYMDPKTAEFQAGSFDLPKGFAQELRSHSFGDSALSQSKEVFPLILCSPGLGEPQHTYQGLCEELASRGFVVAGINHTYSTHVTVFPDGTFRTWDDFAWNWEDPERFPQAIHANIYEWLADAQHVLDVLGALEWEQEDHPFAGRLNVDEVGYFGHSYGGSTALLAGLHDPRVVAVVDMDGEPLGEQGRPHQLEVPALLLTIPGSKMFDEFHRSECDRLVEFRGGTHFTFSDAPRLQEMFRSPKNEESSTHLGGLRGLELTRTLVGRFFRRHLLEQPDPSFESWMAAQPELVVVP